MLHRRSSLTRSQGHTAKAFLILDFLSNHHFLMRKYHNVIIIGSSYRIFISSLGSHLELRDWPWLEQWLFLMGNRKMGQGASEGQESRGQLVFINLHLIVMNIINYPLISLWRYEEIEDYDFKTGESRNGNLVGHFQIVLIISWNTIVCNEDCWNCIKIALYMYIFIN